MQDCWATLENVRPENVRAMIEATNEYEVFKQIWKSPLVLLGIPGPENNSV
jgi:hypothetical protein